MVTEMRGLWNLYIRFPSLSLWVTLAFFTLLGGACLFLPSHRDLAPVQIDLAAACTDSGKLSRKCEYPPQKRRNRSFPWQHGNKNGAVALLGFQAFQRGFIRRNWPRDDEARLKSLEEKPSVPAGGASVPAGGVNCSLHAAMKLSSSFSVLGNLLRLVRNESSCSPWSFSAPSSEDLAWISNQVDPTRFFMIFHADHTCS